MTITPPPQIPAAWYLDPGGTGGLRWWDGHAWTDHVTLPPPPPSVDTWQTEPYQPGRMAVVLNRAPTLVYTSAVWWVALTPVWITAIRWVEIYFGFDGLFGGLIVIAGWLLSAALTMSDRRQLILGGYTHAASTWWWLLTPFAYLVARGIHVHRETRRGWAPAIVFIVVPVAAGVVYVLFVSGFPSLIG